MTVKKVAISQITNMRIICSWEMDASTHIKCIKGYNSGPSKKKWVKSHLDLPSVVHNSISKF